MIFGVVLAGGKSTRMGQDKFKLMLPESNRSLLDHAKALLESANVDKVLVSGNGFDIADKYQYIGPIGGIASSMQYLKEKNAQAEGCVFIPIDMPMLEPDSIATLFTNGREKNCLRCFHDSILPLYVPLSDEMLHQIAMVIRNKEYSLRYLLKLLPNAPLPSPPAPQLININTPNEWHDWLNANQ